MKNYVFRFEDADANVRVDRGFSTAPRVLLTRNRPQFNDIGPLDGLGTSLAQILDRMHRVALRGVALCLPSSPHTGLGRCDLKFTVPGFN